MGAVKWGGEVGNGRVCVCLAPVSGWEKDEFRQQIVWYRAPCLYLQPPVAFLSSAEDCRPSHYFPARVSDSGSELWSWEWFRVPVSRGPGAAGCCPARLNFDSETASAGLGLGSGFDPPGLDRPQAATSTGTMRGEAALPRRVTPVGARDPS